MTITDNKREIKAILSDGSIIYPKSDDPCENLYKLAAEIAKDSDLFVVQIIEI